MGTDTTKEAQEVISGGDDVSGEKPEESSSNPEMLTREQAEKLANEKHSKLDKRIAELEKTTTKAAKIIEAAESRAAAAEEALANAERAKEEAEFEKVRGDPDALSTFQTKKAVKDAEARVAKDRALLAKERAEHAEALAEIANFKIVQAASEIASKYKGVVASELIDLTDGSPEKMEKMAIRLSSGKAIGSKAGDSFVPDSGDGKGDSGQSTAEQRANWSMEQYKKWAEARFK